VRGAGKCDQRPTLSFAHDRMFPYGDIAYPHSITLSPATEVDLIRSPLSPRPAETEEYNLSIGSGARTLHG
jgi:hypothetical protein